MTVWMTGSSGFIGSALAKSCKADGFKVIRLVRGQARAAEEVPWDTNSGAVQAAAADSPHAVIHLAAVSIAGRRWSAAHEREVYRSRVQVTRALCENLAQMHPGPKVLLCASAVGYYGDRGAEPLTESSPQGKGVICELVREWEAACDPARHAGIRVVNLRTAVVLDPKGGALKRMLLPYRLGVGGPLGNGQHYMPWITLQDTVRVYRHALEREDLSGAVNAASPNPVTMNDFSRTLANILHRPNLFRVPRFALSLLLGKQLAEMILYSARVLPRALEQSAFSFQHPHLEAALASLLKRPA